MFVMNMFTIPLHIKRCCGIDKSVSYHVHRNTEILSLLLTEQYSINSLSCVMGSGVVHELAVNLHQADRYLLQVLRFQRRCLHCRPN